MVPWFHRATCRFAAVPASNARCNRRSSFLTFSAAATFSAAKTSLCKRSVSKLRSRLLTETCSSAFAARIISTSSADDPSSFASLSER